MTSAPSTAGANAVERNPVISPVPSSSSPSIAGASGVGEKTLKTLALSGLREAPVVGQYYLVPAVCHTWHGVEAYWPVLGPMHTDADFFRFPDRHYHIDARFVSGALERRVSRRAGGDMVAAAQSYPLSRRRGLDENDLPDGRPVLRRMKCRSAAFPYRFGYQPAVAKLRAHYGDPALPIIRPDGRMLCPHRKVDLSQFAPDADGLVTCPLHGLRVRCAAPEVSHVG